MILFLEELWKASDGLFCEWVYFAMYMYFQSTIED